MVRVDVISTEELESGSYVAHDGEMRMSATSNETSLSRTPPVSPWSWLCPRA